MEIVNKAKYTVFNILYSVHFINDVVLWKSERNLKAVGWGEINLNINSENCKLMGTGVKES